MDAELFEVGSSSVCLSLSFPTLPTFFSYMKNLLKYNFRLIASTAYVFPLPRELVVIQGLFFIIPNTSKAQTQKERFEKALKFPHFQKNLNTFLGTSE